MIDVQTRAWFPQISSGLALLLVSFAAASISAQPIPDPSYEFSFSSTSATAFTGSTVEVNSIFDVISGADPIAGWSYSICHDPGQLAPNQVEAGIAISSLKNGDPADFLDLQFDPGLGVTMGLLVCFTGCATLQPPVSALNTATITYEVLGAAGTNAELTYCDTVAIGGNPVETLVVTAAAGQRIPTMTAINFTIAETQFLRGDCDGNGVPNLADAIVLLGTLFGTPVNPLGCRSACDTNDDGMLNIADAIRLLTYLFASGLPLDPPFPDCGVDPTVDSLDCLEVSPAC